MSSLAYYLVWLAIALVLAALASAQIARQLRLNELRRIKALELVDALEQYSMGLAAQRDAVYFNCEADSGDADEPPLEAVRSIVDGWFPERGPALVELLLVHARLADFLWAQQVQRLRDPEAWLEADHDRRFLALWRHHRLALAAVAGGLDDDGAAGVRPQPGPDARLAPDQALLESGVRG